MTKTLTDVRIDFQCITCLRYYYLTMFPLFLSLFLSIPFSSLVIMLCVKCRKYVFEFWKMPGIIVSFEGTSKQWTIHSVILSYYSRWCWSWCWSDCYCIHSTDFPVQKLLRYYYYYYEFISDRFLSWLRCCRLSAVGISSFLI